MTKDQILSFVRSLLIAVGAFFAGKNLFGTTLDQQTWLGISGAVVSLVMVVWGIVDKTVTIEMFQSGIRGFIIMITTFLVSSGRLMEDTVKNILAIVDILLPVIYGQLSMMKSKNIASGKTAIADLKGVDESKPQDITPRVTEPKK